MFLNLKWAVSWFNRVKRISFAPSNTAAAHFTQLNGINLRRNIDVWRRSELSKLFADIPHRESLWSSKTTTLCSGYICVVGTVWAARTLAFPNIQNHLPKTLPKWLSRPFKLTSICDTNKFENSNISCGFRCSHV